jgi:pyruvate dehydrogenase E2 component (dihydrolipoamide acetyltransferase)
MDVLMPQLGETVAEGKITQWFKSTGDPIKPGDNLFEIETDKVSMEVPSTTAGVLAEIRVPAGEVAPVGAVVAVIADRMSAAQRGEPTAQPGAIAAPPPSSPVGCGADKPSFAALPPATASPKSIKLDPFFEVRTPARNYGRARLAGGTAVTPLARRYAAEAGIDLSGVPGTGPRGRIIARDVEAARATGAGAPAAAAPFPVPTADRIKAIYRDAPFVEVPLDGMRRTIAKRLIQAKQTVPHFYLTADIAIARLLDLRETANGAAPKDLSGNAVFKLSINDLLVKAWAAALVRVPDANAVWAEDRILRFEHSDIGVAIAIEGGLMAPVIRRAETKTLSAISQEVKDLTARARARKLDASEYQCGATTLSNLGMYGVREFSAIINPPRSTILGVGAARRAPVENEDGSIAFTSIMSVTLSCDHRVVDGAVGAQLLAAFRSIVEQPVTMLI